MRKPCSGSSWVLRREVPCASSRRTAGRASAEPARAGFGESGETTVIASIRADGEGSISKPRRHGSGGLEPIYSILERPTTEDRESRESPRNTRNTRKKYKKR